MTLDYGHDHRQHSFHDDLIEFSTAKGRCHISQTQTQPDNAPRWKVGTTSCTVFHADIWKHAERYTLNRSKPRFLRLLPRAPFASLAVWGRWISNGAKI